MGPRLPLLAAICASVCYTNPIAASTTDNIVPSENIKVGLRPESAAAGHATALQAAEQRVSEVSDNENEEDISTDSEVGSQDSSMSAGLEKRRLKAGGKGGRGKKGAWGWSHILLLLGSLITSSAIWRKTSELHYSPLQALRKAKMRILGQVPASWDAYVSKLPIIDETDFPELRPLMQRLQKKPVVVMCIPRPTANLSSFLGLTEQQRREGIVIKAKATAECTAKEVAFELFAHEHLAKGLPLTLPALGAYRDVDSATLFLITPRARADVAQYTRKMPEKVHLRLAWAEMIYALWGMHKRGWVHRDIKSFNYFVSQSGHALLADFEGYWRDGLQATIYGEEIEIIFTDKYIAPEMTFDGEYQMFDTKSDVYALGVTFQEMLKWMSSTRVPQLRLAEDLVKHMLEPDPKQRYSLPQCMEHQYFKGIDFAELENFKYGKSFEGSYLTPYKFL